MQALPVKGAMCRLRREKACVWMMGLSFSLNYQTYPTVEYDGIGIGFQYYVF